jgi:hypothetical protein
MRATVGKGLAVSAFPQAPSGTDQNLGFIFTIDNESKGLDMKESSEWDV